MYSCMYFSFYETVKKVQFTHCGQEFEKNETANKIKSFRSLCFKSSLHVDFNALFIHKSQFDRKNNVIYILFQEKILFVFIWNFSRNTIKNETLYLL